MVESDTIKLLRECNAGVKMGVSSIEEVLPKVKNEKLKELKKHVAVGFWEKPDSSHTVIRFATSWATTEENVMRLCADLKKILAESNS